MIIIIKQLRKKSKLSAIGCTKNYQPIGMTVHLHSVESFEGLLQRCRREGGVAVNCEKNTIFPEHPVQLA